MPGVLGCIDGTHIAIVKPHHFEERFFNRKRYHSLNAQIVSTQALLHYYHSLFVSELNNYRMKIKPDKSQNNKILICE